MRHYKVSSMPASMKTLLVGIISHFHVFVHLVDNTMEQKQFESVKTKDICLVHMDPYIALGSPPHPALLTCF